MTAIFLLYRRDPRQPGQLAEAVARFRERTGHFPACGHRFIRSQADGSWVSHRPGLDCPADYPCEGDGSPCSSRCLAANRALGFLQERETLPLFAALEKAS